MRYNLINFLNDRENKVIYDKNLRKITWSLTSAILLQQCIYWSEKNKWNKFFKFIEPCNHELYKEWDSWCEELWFSKKEFNWAIKKIWFKLWKNNKNEISKEEAIIIYYTDSSRVTWYSINYDLLNKLLNGIYLVSDKRSLSIVSDKRELTTVSDKRWFTINTETTTETTAEIEAIASKPVKEKKQNIVKNINLDEVKAYKNNHIIIYLYEMVNSNYVKQSFNTESFIKLYDYIIEKSKEYWFADNETWKLKDKELKLELEKINNYYEVKWIKNFKSTFLNWISRINR